MVPIYGPVSVVENALQFLHSSTGLPWWATIASTTLLLRTLMVPMFVSQIRSIDEMQKKYIPLALEALQKGSPQVCTVCTLHAYAALCAVLRCVVLRAD